MRAIVAGDISGRGRTSLVVGKERGHIFQPRVVPRSWLGGSCRDDALTSCESDIWIIACPFRRRHNLLFRSIHSLFLLCRGPSSAVPVMRRFSYGAVSKPSGFVLPA